MPQLELFILADGAVTICVVFGLVHLLIVGYLLPVWLRIRVLSCVLLSEVYCKQIFNYVRSFC